MIAVRVPMPPMKGSGSGIRRARGSGSSGRRSRIRGQALPAGPRVRRIPSGTPMAVARPTEQDDQQDVPSGLGQDSAATGSPLRPGGRSAPRGLVGGSTSGVPYARSRPSASNAMRSASARASRTSWVTKIEVLPSLRWSARKSRWSSRRVTGSSAAERLVEEQERRIGRERARHADPLALAAGQLARIALAELGGRQAHARGARRRGPRGGRGPIPRARARCRHSRRRCRCGSRPMSWIT